MSRPHKYLIVTLCVLLPLKAEAAFTLISSNSAEDDSSATTISTTVAGITSGSLVVVCTGHIGGVVAGTISDGNGNSATLAGTMSDTVNSLEIGWYLASSVSGSITYTATFASSVPYRTIAVMAFSYTGTASGDGFNTEGTLDTAVRTGAITTVGTDDVAVACMRSSFPMSGFLLGGLAPTTTIQPFSLAAMFYKPYSSAQVGLEGTATASDFGFNIAGIKAFKAVADAAGGPRGGTISILDVGR